MNSANVQYTISGGPDGKVVAGIAIVDGRFAEANVGRVSKPDCRVSLSHDLLSDIVDGSVDLDAAYMTGGIKVEGDHALWLVDLSELNGQVMEALLHLPPAPA